MRDGLFLGGALAPAGLSVSFLRAEMSSVVDHLMTWRRELGHTVDSTAITLDETLQSIEPFESPWTRELIFDCGDWTGYLNNQIDGGDPSAAAPYLSSALGVDLIVAIHAPRHSPGHESTQMWVLGPQGEPPLMYRRTIAADCADGRWSWHESGDPLPFEDPDRYTARRVRDRFDRPTLLSYLRANGIDADSRSFWGQGLVVTQSVSYRTRKETAAQVRDRFGW